MNKMCKGRTSLREKVSEYSEDAQQQLQSLGQSGDVSKKLAIKSSPSIVTTGDAWGAILWGVADNRELLPPST